MNEKECVLYPGEHYAAIPDLGGAGPPNWVLVCCQTCGTYSFDPRRRAEAAAGPPLEDPTRWEPAHKAALRDSLKRTHDSGGDDDLPSDLYVHAANKAFGPGGQILARRRRAASWKDNSRLLLLGLAVVIVWRLFVMYLAPYLGLG